MPNLTLRLTDALHAELVAAAEANGRSLQREIVVRLDGRAAPALVFRDEVHRFSEAEARTVADSVDRSVSGRTFRGPDPKGGKRGGLGSGEVPAGSPPVTGLGSPEPSSTSAASQGSGKAGPVGNPATGEGGSSRPAPSFRPDPKSKSR